VWQSPCQYHNILPKYSSKIFTLISPDRERGFLSTLILRWMADLPLPGPANGRLCGAGCDGRTFVLFTLYSIAKTNKSGNLSKDVHLLS